MSTRRSPSSTTVTLTGFRFAMLSASFFGLPRYTWCHAA
jgi:hypothetical protein